MPLIYPFFAVNKKKWVNCAHSNLIVNQPMTKEACLGKLAL